MKNWAAGLGLLGCACAAMSSFQESHITTVVITGDLSGHLEPCGCTSPMSGGILRQAQLIKQLRLTADVTVLANGAMVAGHGPQDELKAETVAQAYDEMSVSAINLADEDAKLGIGGVYAIQNNSNSRLISGSINGNAAIPIKETSQTGQFLIGGISMHSVSLASSLHAQATDTDEAVSKLLSEAKQLELTPILLLDGNEEEAKTLATKHQDLRMIVYRSPNTSPDAAETVGRTILVTPGEGGKTIVRALYDGANFSAYQVLPLGPDVTDNVDVARFYKDYLRRVDARNFLATTARHPSNPFAGSKACESCHKQAYDTWVHSKHATAYRSLETKGHGKDPDCVSCHVVGLQNISGFRSRAQTPDLADVGCESCHGPGKLHVKNPRGAKMGISQLSSCITCHTSEQSPNFKPLIYWPKIKHG